MEIEILKEKDNKLLNRKELELRIKHPNAPTPKKEEIKEELSKMFNVDKEQIVINYVLSKKGLQEAIAKVKILYQKPKGEEVKNNETQANKS